MNPSNLDSRVLSALKAGHATAKAISEAEGINSTAARNALERLESRGQVIRRGSLWKVLG
jgi:predicted ArsR family transcriptional regulator